MKKVSGPQVVTTTGEASELPLPAEIQEALGELVGAAREGAARADCWSWPQRRASPTAYPPAWPAGPAPGNHSRRPRR